jgi:hypothetical protein
VEIRVIWRVWIGSTKMERPIVETTRVTASGFEENVGVLSGKP